MTAASDEFGESSYDNALPWTSISRADYKVVADLKPLIPMLQARHQARAEKDPVWKSFVAEIADARRIRAEKTLSLNETVRTTERDEQEAKRKAREALLAGKPAAADAASPTGESGKTGKVAQGSAGTVVSTEDDSDPVATAAIEDDGLQADERSISKDLAREEKRKAKPDIVLNEVAQILSDEIDLIRNDTKLAARVLPHDAAAGVD